MLIMYRLLMVSMVCRLLMMSMMHRFFMVAMMDGFFMMNWFSMVFSVCIMVNIFSIVVIYCWMTNSFSSDAFSSVSSWQLVILDNFLFNLWFLHLELENSIFDAYLLIKESSSLCIECHIV